MPCRGNEEGTAPLLLSVRVFGGSQRCAEKGGVGPALGGTLFLDFTFWTLPAANACFYCPKAVPRSAQLLGQRGCARGLRAGHAKRDPERPRAAPCTTAPAGAPRAATRLGFPSTAAARALPIRGRRCGPVLARSFHEHLEHQHRRLALPPQLLSITASAGWGVMIQRA